MLQIDHIGIAVKELASSIPLFEKLLNSHSYKREYIESEKVTVAFFKTGETKIELLESTTEDSLIAKYISKKGESVHHIAFEVADIYLEIERLKKEGFMFINDVPKKGADNKIVCFLHPKNTKGILIELCQSIA